jgi:hypothetical protein
MATLYKVLGQSDPASNTLTTLYTVPASTNTIVSTLAVCNRSNSTPFRIAVRPAGAALLNEHYIVYDNYVEQNDSVFLTLGLTLGATDVVSVFVNANTGANSVSFSLFGSEIT